MCIRDRVNASVVTTRMDGYTETGAGNMGLNVAKQELTTGTVALLSLIHIYYISGLIKEHFRILNPLIITNDIVWYIIYY